MNKIIFIALMMFLLSQCSEYAIVFIAIALFGGLISYYVINLLRVLGNKGVIR